MASSDAEIFGQLSRSQIYRDYQQAFSVATKLPLTLRPPKKWSPAQKDHENENPFCALLSHSSTGCAACLEMQQKISDPQATEAVSATCFAGLCDTAIPVRTGDKLIGFLQTGQVALKPPTRKAFRHITSKLIEWGVQVDLRKLEDSYFHSRVLSPTQYAGMVRLLEIFGGHLGAIGNQLAIQDSNKESPFTRRAKKYVLEHQSDPIHLEEVAKALNMSTFYFCKMFKQATGLTFTNYVGRVRVERAKTLLLDPHRRISEVAYEVGFGSLTHFNRLFGRLAGQSPSSYRESVTPSRNRTKPGKSS